MGSLLHDVVLCLDDGGSLRFLDTRCEDPGVCPSVGQSNFAVHLPVVFLKDPEQKWCGSGFGGF